MARPRPCCMLGRMSFMDSLRPERERAGGALPTCDERLDDCERDLSSRDALLSRDEATTGGSRFSVPMLKWLNMECGWKLWGDALEGSGMPDEWGETMLL